MKTKYEVGNTVYVPFDIDEIKITAYGVFYNASSSCPKEYKKITLAKDEIDKMKVEEGYAKWIKHPD